MAAYTPPTISDGDAFNASTFVAGFTSLRTALNGNLETTNNFTTTDKTFRTFRPNSITEVFSESSTDVVTFIEALNGSGINLPSVTVEVWDVPDAGVKFYLHDAADVMLSSFVGLRRNKAVWLAGGDILTHIISVALKLDSVTIYSETRNFTETNAEQFLSCSFSPRATSLSLAAGWHKLQTTIDMSSSATTVGTADLSSQWYSTSRRASALAFYK